MTATEDFVDSTKETVKVLPDVVLGITSGLVFMIVPVLLIGLAFGASRSIMRRSIEVF